MSKGLPFDLIGLVFDNLDVFVEVDRVKVACKEERKLSSTRKESKESKEVEVLPVTENAERLASSGFPLTIAYPVRIRKAPLIRPRMGLTNSQITLYALNEPVACLSTTISAVKDV